MKGILDAIVMAKQKVENNINVVTMQECEQLKLYEQLAALERAESAVRAAIRAEHEAKENNPQMFLLVTPQPLVVA